MMLDQRKDERFIDIGPVEAPELCVFSGVLEDISLLGGKIRFPALIDVDSSSEITLKIVLSNSHLSEPLILIGQPKWSTQEDSSTQIGFSFLRSPGTPVLNAYIEKLALANAEFEEEEELLCSGM